VGPTENDKATILGNKIKMTEAVLTVGRLQFVFHLSPFPFGGPFLNCSRLITPSDSSSTILCTPKKVHVFVIWISLQAYLSVHPQTRNSNHFQVLPRCP
jgi:hypothetical protein